MAVVKAVKEGASLKRVIDYVDKEDSIKSGVNCPDDKKEALEQMKETKKEWGKEGGRQYKHYVQSFEEGTISAEKAHLIGREWAEKCFPEHEVYIATHTEKNNIHNHVVVNSVNMSDGKKIQVSDEDLENFKRISDDICKRENLPVIDRENKESNKKFTSFNQAKYQAMKKIEQGGKSWLLDGALNVEKCSNVATSKEDFIKKMEKLGYKTTWSDHLKHVTFEKDGRKMRLSNLNKTFGQSHFTKDGLQNKFNDNNIQKGQSINGFKQSFQSSSPNREGRTNQGNAWTGNSTSRNGVHFFKGDQRGTNALARIGKQQQGSANIGQAIGKITGAIGKIMDTASKSSGVGTQQPNSQFAFPNRRNKPSKQNNKRNSKSRNAKRKQSPSIEYDR